MDEEPLPLEPGPARVLVVEDEPKLAALLADYLRAAGHEAECVGDGRDALQAWTERRHDLVLLDLMLPGLDGLEPVPTAARAHRRAHRHADRTGRRIGPPRRPRTGRR